MTLIKCAGMRAAAYTKVFDCVRQTFKYSGVKGPFQVRRTSKAPDLNLCSAARCMQQQLLHAMHLDQYVGGTRIVARSLRTKVCFGKVCFEGVWRCATRPTARVLGGRGGGGGAVRQRCECTEFCWQTCSGAVAAFLEGLQNCSCSETLSLNSRRHRLVSGVASVRAGTGGNHPAKRASQLSVPRLFRGHEARVGRAAGHQDHRAGPACPPPLPPLPPFLYLSIILGLAVRACLAIFSCTRQLISRHMCAPHLEITYQKHHQKPL